MCRAETSGDRWTVKQDKKLEETKRRAYLRVTDTKNEDQAKVDCS